MNKVKWIIFVALTIGVFGLLIAFSNNSRLDISTIDPNATQPADSQNGNIGDHIFGNLDSKVILIEYADYQCPPCASAYPSIKKIVDQYKEKIQFIFRNFPITTSHPNAKAAAGTAEAAGLQGKYWEMHDKIYNSQSDWSNLSGTERTNFFANYAQDLNLDMDKFNSDISGNTNGTSINKKINYDYALGKKAGVDATPSFYLNGVRLEPDIWSNSTKLIKAIDSELKNTNSL